MTSQEIVEGITKLLTKQQLLTIEIKDAARNVLPVLLDSGKQNSAKPLQDLFAELDACDQSIVKLVEQDPKTAMMFLMSILQPDGTSINSTSR